MRKFFEMDTENRSIKVVFYSQTQEPRVVSVEAASTIMDSALDNNIAGIEGQCGGGCTCSTCHCYIREPWLTFLPPPSEDEKAILHYVEGRRPNSRLTCQIFLNPSLDGIEIDIPNPA